MLTNFQESSTQSSYTPGGSDYNTPSLFIQPKTMDMSFNLQPMQPSGMDELYCFLKQLGVYDKYCWWSESPPKTLGGNINSVKPRKQCKASSFQDSSYDSIKARKRRISKPDLEENLKTLLRKLDSGEISGFYHCEKVERKNSKRRSGRQSKYIGVSRNGNYWQVLKNFNNEKKYIGGFTREIEAAITYDFYSMAIDFARARTNFNYSPALIKEMVQHYMSNNKTFDPVAFLDRV